jgi:hypothetical protein
VAAQASDFPFYQPFTVNLSGVRSFTVLGALCGTAILFVFQLAPLRKSKSFQQPFRPPYPQISRVIQVRVLLTPHGHA